jgi:hypothetical protein
MHCPACGQQQVSNETKFCSRCGLPLGLVAELLAHGGFLPQLAELNKKKKSLLTRRNGLGFSLIWFIFWLLIMAPLGGIANVEEFAAFSAIMGIFGGLILMVSSLIFLKKEVPGFAFSQQQLYGQQQHMPAAGYSALPPQQSVPASAYTTPGAGRWRDTNDLEPSSVTESTTRLLKEDER